MCMCVCTYLWVHAHVCTCVHVCACARMCVDLGPERMSDSCNVTQSPGKWKRWQVRVPRGKPWSAGVH